MAVTLKRALGTRPKQPAPKEKPSRPPRPPTPELIKRIPPPPPNDGDEPTVMFSTVGGVSGLPELTTVGQPPEANTAFSVPPLSQRENRDAKEPLTGTILEMWDGEIYHYGLYVEKGLVLGVHKPPAAVSIAKVELTPLSLYWRPVYTPQYLISPYHISRMVPVNGSLASLFSLWLRGGTLKAVLASGG